MRTLSVDCSQTDTKCMFYSASRTIFKDLRTFWLTCVSATSPWKMATESLKSLQKSNPSGFFILLRTAAIQLRPTLLEIL